MNTTNLYIYILFFYDDVCVSLNLEMMKRSLLFDTDRRNSKKKRRDSFRISDEK